MFLCCTYFVMKFITCRNESIFLLLFSCFVHKGIFLYEKQVKKNLLFNSIAGLSKIEDPCNAAGAEGPGKVSKLMNSNGQLEIFLSMYKYQISRLGKVGVIGVGTGSSASHTSSLNQKQHEQGFIKVYLNDEL